VIAGDTTCDAPPRGVRLLPYFDAYTVGCHPRQLIFPGRAADRALSGGQAANRPVLLINGTIAGIWHQRRSASRLEITVEPFAPHTTTERRELDGQAEHIGQIFEIGSQLTLGAVAVASHA
jgi:hypothetical protein